MSGLDDRRHGVRKWFGTFYKVTMTAEYSSYDEEGDEETLIVGCVFEICPTCQGKERHVNPNIDDNGISAQEFHDDPDFREAYMSGAYDVECQECEGTGKVPSPSEEDPNYERITKEIQEQDEQDYYDRQVMAAEMGWR